MTLQEFVDRHCVGRQYDSCIGTPCTYSGGAGCIHPLHPWNARAHQPAAPTGEWSNDVPAGDVKIMDLDDFLQRYAGVCG